MIISFIVDSKNCWKRDNIKVELEGSSSYKVTVEGSVKEEDVICLVPDTHSLLEFLSQFFNGAKIVFKSQPESGKINPMSKC